LRTEVGTIEPKTRPVFPKTCLKFGGAHPPDPGRAELAVLSRVKSSVGRYDRVSTEEESSMSKNSTKIRAAVVREKGRTF